MKPKHLLPLLLLAAACSAPEGLSDADRQGIEAQVRAATAELQSALNAHDPDAILAHYSLDVDFVYVGCTNSMFGGELFGNIVGQYHRTNTEATYEYAVQSVRVLGPASAVVSLQGAAGPLEMFVTRALVRGDDGAWRIAYEHESWPGCAAPRAPHPGTAPGDTSLVLPEGEGA